MTTEDRKSRSHEHEVIIDADPDDVWQAITDARLLTRWFPLGAEVAPGPGGHIRLSWGKDFDYVCPITAWEPGRHLRISWMDPLYTPEGGEEKRRGVAVDWILEGRGGRTVLRLVHSGFGAARAWDEEFDATRRGWAFELLSLKHALERHAGVDRSACWIRQPVDQEAGAVWHRLFGSAQGLLSAGALAGLRPGDPFDLTLSSGDRLNGKVLIIEPPLDFAGTLPGLGHGLFRYGYEAMAGHPEAILWLSLWGRPASEVQSIEARWRAALARALA